MKLHLACTTSLLLAIGAAGNGLSFLSGRASSFLQTSVRDTSSIPKYHPDVRPDVIRMTLHRVERPRTSAHSAAPHSARDWSLLQTQTIGSDISSANGPPPVDIFGQITVGTPPQLLSVAIDTGSSNLLLTSINCRSVACLAHKAYVPKESNSSGKLKLGAEGDSEAVQIAVSTGETEGQLYEDVVCLGSAGQVCAKTSFVALTKMSQEPFNMFPYDGILGVGMPGGSIDKTFNFLGNLADNGLMMRNRFAVWLKTEEDDSESEITFGDFLEERLGSEILWLPTSRADSGVWQANLIDVAVNNVKLGGCGLDGCQAAFDTGTSAIAGSDSFISGILNRLDIQEDCSNYDSLPLFGFNFRMYILNIEAQDYVKKAGGRCYHQFLKIDIPPPKGPLVLLGDPFMRRYFTIFDRDSLKVGVAFSNHQGVAGSAESSAQRAVRLMQMTR